MFVNLAWVLYIKSKITDEHLAGEEAVEVTSLDPSIQKQNC